MHKKENFLPFFITFFILSLLLILLGTTGIFGDIQSIFNKAMGPGKSVTYIFTLKSLQNKAIESLTTENMTLRNQMKDEKNLVTENVALKSQFSASQDTSPNLLPAKVIGSPGFIPGVTLPEYLIINKGEKAGVKTGSPVLSNNFLVGKIIKTYPDFSKIELITNKNSSFTAKVVGDTDSNGILKGVGGGEMVFDNVLLTTTLKKGEDVLTKGDKDENGHGYPPDINIGKIYSIDKNQSDLFQKASIKSPVDFKNLNIVFVIR